MIDLDQLKHHLLAGTRIDPECIPENGPVILPKDMTLADLEPYMGAPYRYRGRFTTGLPEEFVAYITANADPLFTPHCFVGDSGLSEPTAEAIFDFGSPDQPLWREHRAVLDIERSDGTIVNPAVARTEFADLTVEQVKNLRSKQADFARERSAVERMSMGSGLPNRLHFTCTPWRGLGSARLTLRISAADSAGALALRLNLIGWPAVRTALVEELIEKLLQTPITVRRGRFTAGLRPASAAALV
jgi:uncharacterized protein YfdQ (DUF2303 family)